MSASSLHQSTRRSKPSGHHGANGSCRWFLLVLPLWKGADALQESSKASSTFSRHACIDPEFSADLQFEPSTVVGPVAALERTNAAAEEVDLPSFMLPREYAFVNSALPSSHWDYEKMEITYSDLNEFDFGEKLGGGQYSEVYEARRMDQAGWQEKDFEFAVKLLKHTKKEKIQREVRVMEALCGGPHILPLMGVMRDEEGRESDHNQSVPGNRTVGLAFRKAASQNWKKLYPQFGLDDIRLYGHKILTTLDFAHRRGIIHRDIKPHNVLIDHPNKRLFVIDWGLAEFFLPGRTMSSRVCSKHYKAPELLLKENRYHYAIDSFAFGCWLAGAAFDLFPFFDGRDPEEQVMRIAEMRGTAELEAFAHRYNLELPSSVREFIAQNSAVDPLPWSTLVDSDNEHRTSDELFDLLDGLLAWDPEERLLPFEALMHPFFAPLQETEDTNGNWSPMKKRSEGLWGVEEEEDTSWMALTGTTLTSTSTPPPSTSGPLERPRESLPLSSPSLLKGGGRGRRPGGSGSEESSSQLFSAGSFESINGRDGQESVGREEETDGSSRVGGQGLTGWEEELERGPLWQGTGNEPAASWSVLFQHAGGSSSSTAASESSKTLPSSFSPERRRREGGELKEGSGNRAAENSKWGFGHKIQELQGGSIKVRAPDPVLLSIPVPKTEILTEFIA